MPVNKKKREYQRLDRDFIVSNLIDFFNDTSEVSFSRFCCLRSLNSKRKSLSQIANEVGLFKHKDDKATSSFMWAKLMDHLKKKGERESFHMNSLKKLNTVLTGDEINLITSTCGELSSMGLGIDEDTCLHVVNTVLEQRIDERDFVEVTRGVVHRLLKNNAELLKLCKGNSIDPARVRQADEEVLKTLFVKLDNMIRLLHSQGKVPWSSYADVPAASIYNMDEVATNCHNHRKKTIALKSLLGRLFQECNAGDNKMPMHITLAITSCATGKFILLKYFADINYQWPNTTTNKNRYLQVTTGCNQWCMPTCHHPHRAGIG